MPATSAVKWKNLRKLGFAGELDNLNFSCFVNFMQYFEKQAIGIMSLGVINLGVHSTMPISKE